MVRYFRFHWYKNKNGAIDRHNLITVTEASGDIGRDAHAATNMFCYHFGNLKNNTIIEIQEVDKDNNEIGEPIVPDNDTSIVPTKHK